MNKTLKTIALLAVAAISTQANAVMFVAGSPGAQANHNPFIGTAPATHFSASVMPAMPTMPISAPASGPAMNLGFPVMPAQVPASVPAPQFSMPMLQPAPANAAPATHFGTPTGAPLNLSIPL